jgi:hypothetical protein
MKTDMRTWLENLVVIGSLPDRWLKIFEGRVAMLQEDAYMTEDDAKGFALREVQKMMQTEKGRQ